MGLKFMGSSVIRIFLYVFHNVGKGKRGTNKMRLFFSNML